MEGKYEMIYQIVKKQCTMSRIISWVGRFNVINVLKISKINDFLKCQSLQEET
jgi:hypothetical protein